MPRFGSLLTAALIAVGAALAPSAIASVPRIVIGEDFGDCC